MRNIGDKTEFSFGEFQLVAQLQNSGVSMWRKLQDDICPHCKEIIEKKVNYVFDLVEVWVRPGLDINCDIKDMTILGYAADGSVLLLTVDKYEEVLQKVKESVN
jgi:hypothetical protein